MAKSETTDQNAKTPLWRRLLPLGVLILAIAAFFGSGLHRYISFDQLAMNYAGLTGWVDNAPLLAGVLAALAYALAVALSFPAAWILTVGIGLIFGWVWGSLIVLVGATAGAVALFLIAKYALSEFFKNRAGSLLNKMADGFREDAVSYMLFMRLTPVFPFTLVNALPGILGVSLPVFALTTFFGIIPGVVAYSFAGEGLRSIIIERADACAANQPSCGTPISASDIVTPQILIAFFLLAIVALVPVVIKRLNLFRRKL